MPALQTPCGVQLVWFGEDEYVSSGQGAHWRFVVSVPGVLTWVPGAQLVQAVQLVALAVVLKLALPHAAHWRSAVALPVTATICPGSQSVHGTQAVAARPS